MDYGSKKYKGIGVKNYEKRNYEEKVKDYEYQIRLFANEYMAENPEIKCELNEYGNVEIYDLSIEQVNELIRKYDLKELYGVEYQIDDDVMLKSCDEH